MRLVITLLVASGLGFGQIGTPSGSQGGAQGAATTSTTGAHTTTAGDLIFAFAGGQAACAGGFGQFGLPTDTGGNTYTPIIPTSGSYLLGARIVNGGSGCVSDPSTCTITGGGGTGATCTATQSGGVVNAVNIGNAGAGDYTSAPTISISGSSCSGVTAQVVTYGVGDISSGSCSAAWYAKNVAATTNNAITANYTASIGFNGIVAAEVSGLNTGSVLDASPGGSSAAALSITTNSFNTTTADEIVLCGSRVEALAQTWVAGISPAYTLVSGGTLTDTYISSQFKIYSSTQTGVTSSISSTASAARGIICGTFKIAGGGGSPVITRRFIGMGK